MVDAMTVGHPYIPSSHGKMPDFSLFKHETSLSNTDKEMHSPGAPSPSDCPLSPLHLSLQSEVATVTVPLSSSLISPMVYFWILSRSQTLEERGSTTELIS